MLELTAIQRKLLHELLENFDGDVQGLLSREGLLGEISKRAIEAAIS